GEQPESLHLTLCAWLIDTPLHRRRCPRRPNSPPLDCPAPGANASRFVSTARASCPVLSSSA
ncbi:MAG: hypothetical protein ACKO7Z_07600, partial [Cyanobacteriota bacterium]